MKKISVASVVFCVFLCVFVSLPLQVQAAGSWNIQTIAHTDSFFFSLALDSYDKPHVSFQNETQGSLKYATLDNETWRIQTVDSNTKGCGVNSLALNLNGNPCISYIDKDRAILFANWTGTEWDIQNVEKPPAAVGRKNSLAIDSDGNPHVMYYRGGLCYAVWSGSVWRTFKLALHDSEGYTFSFALNSTDNPHITRYRGDLWYSNVIYYNDTYHYERMNRQNLDHDCSGPSSIAIDTNDNPHIAYFRKDGALCYKSWTGNHWNNQTVDPNCKFSDKPYKPESGLPSPTDDWGYISAGISFALDAQNNPHIAYFNGEDLMYASCFGSTWSTALVAADAKSCSLATDTAGNPHIVYLDSKGDLQYATSNRAAPVAWTIPGIIIAAAIIATATIITIRLVKNREHVAAPSAN